METQWKASLYDNRHQFVSKYGENLVELLAPKSKEVILDLGCGTGDLAKEIAKSGATVLGVDASHSMIQNACEKYPSLSFAVKDAREISDDSIYDAVFSNAALHWMKEADVVIENVYRALKENGRFVGEMGGFGNVSSILAAIKQSMEQLGYPYNEQYSPWYFPTAIEYEQLLEKAGFQVEMITLYERPTELIGDDGLINWLKMFSDNLFQNLNSSQKEAIYTKCEEILNPIQYQDGKWIADYCRLRFIAKK